MRLSDENKLSRGFLLIVTEIMNFSILYMIFNAIFDFLNWIKMKDVKGISWRTLFRRTIFYSRITIVVVVFFMVVKVVLKVLDLRKNKI